MTRKSIWVSPITDELIEKARPLVASQLQLDWVSKQQITDHLLLSHPLLQGLQGTATATQNG